MIRLLFCFFLVGDANQAILESYELVWTTLRDHYWDRSMAGLNWQQLHDQYLRRIRSARTVSESRGPIDELIHKLPSSHLAIIPGEVYGESPDPSTPAGHKPHRGQGTTGLTVTPIGRKIVVEFSEAHEVHPGWIIESIDGDSVQKLIELAGNADAEFIPEIIGAWLSGPVGSSAHIVFTKGDGAQTRLDIPRRTPPGKLVEFTNLPPERVMAEHRKLSNGTGYIRLNIFLDPVSVMPEFEQAIMDLRSAPGIVLDLRSNPGGLAVMAMGLAGWFVSAEDQQLGTMQSRTSKTEYEINPRLEPYLGSSRYWSMAVRLPQRRSWHKA